MILSCEGLESSCQTKGMTPVLREPGASESQRLGVHLKSPPAGGPVSLKSLSNIFCELLSRFLPEVA